MSWYIIDLIWDIQSKIKIWSKILDRRKIRAQNKIQDKILARIHSEREICNFCEVQRLVILER